MISSYFISVYFVQLVYCPPWNIQTKTTCLTDHPIVLFVLNNCTFRFADHTRKRKKVSPKRYL